MLLLGVGGTSANMQNAILCGGENHPPVVGCLHMPFSTWTYVVEEITAFLIKGIKNAIPCKDYQFSRALGSLNYRFLKCCSHPGGPPYPAQAYQDAFFENFPGDHGEWLGLKLLGLAEAPGCLNSLGHIWTKRCLNTSRVREFILSVKTALTCISRPCLSLFDNCRWLI